MGGHEYLAGFAVRLAQFLSAGWKALGIAKFDYPLGRGLTLLDLVDALCVIICTFVAVGLVKILLTRKAKQAQEDSKQAKRHFFQLSGHPLYFFIWAFAFYIAIIPILLRLP